MDWKYGGVRVVKAGVAKWLRSESDKHVDILGEVGRWMGQGTMRISR